MLKKKVIETLYITILLLTVAVYCCVAMSDMDNTGGGVNMGLSVYFELFVLGVSFPYLFFLLTELKYLPSASPLFKSWIWYFIYVSILLIFLSTSSNIRGIIANASHNLTYCAVMCSVYLYVKRYGVSTFFLTVCFGAMLLIIWQYTRIYAIAHQVGAVHIGVAYFPLFILPVLMLHPWKTIRYVSVLVVMLVLFSSLKRGGLLAFAVGLLSYLLAQPGSAQSKKIKVYLSVIISLGILLWAFIYLGTQEDNYILERFIDIQNDGGSGRLDIWPVTWNMICQSDFIGFVFGHGYDTVLRDSPFFLSAHNDLLEVWYNYGFIALLLFLLVIYRWSKTMLQMLRQHNAIAPSMLMLFVTTMILIMISHVVVYPWMVLVALSLGVFIGLLDREKTIASHEQ